jgi:hypothetical protein
MEKGPEPAERHEEQRGERLHRAAFLSPGLAVDIIDLLT